MTRRSPVATAHSGLAKQSALGDCPSPSLEAVEDEVEPERELHVVVAATEDALVADRHRKLGDAGVAGRHRRAEELGHVGGGSPRPESSKRSWLSRRCG